MRNMQTVLKHGNHFRFSFHFFNRHMSLQSNELENNRDATNRLGSTTSGPNNGSSNSSQSTTSAPQSNNDEKFTENHKVSPQSTPQVANASDASVKSSAIEGEEKNDTVTASNNNNNNNNDGIKNPKSTKSHPTVIRSAGDVVVPAAAAATSQSDCIETGKTTTECDNEVRVKCENDDDTTSETSSGSGSGSGTVDNVFKTTKHISKPSLGNLHANQGGRALDAPPMTVPLSSPPNVPMFVNRFPNTHPTYIPPHIRNLPKTQSLDLVDSEMPSTLLGITKQASSFDQSRSAYPNAAYGSPPFGSPFGSPRNRRRGPLRESRRISIEQSGSFLQLNQYKLMDQIGQVSCGDDVI